VPRSPAFSATLLSAMLLVAAATPQSRYDWSTTDLSYIGEYAKEAEPTRALCRAVINAEPLAADRPTTSEAKALKDCDSEALYYGIGVARDPLKARKCAFVEDGREPYGGPSQPYYGRGMLAIIYANGVGAIQNYDVAIHMACGLDNAPGDNEPRLELLGKLRAARDPDPRFDTCSNISSGALGGMCAGHDSRIAEVSRDARLAALAKRRGITSAPEWLQLKKRAEAYATAVADNEVDLSGTLRGAFWLEAHDGVIDNFIAVVERMEAGTILGANRTGYAKADAELNRAYRQALADKDRYEYGTVKPEGVRATERAWIAYRDAMLALARKFYPDVSANALATKLTKDRADSL
jgi:hypothetical protein